MSGHNKWSKIKYVKAKEDAKKGKVFARFAHEIMLAARRLPMKATAPQARLS